MARMLALDYGRARIGVAVSDALGITAQPLGFIPRSDDRQAAAVVAALAKKEQVGGIVIGLPLHAHGAAGENVAWVRAFLVELQAVCALPIHELDERYTTSEAEDRLRRRGEWPAPPGRVDALSAVILLERHLAGER